jgi:dipeptide transport system ATP-binding protein
VADDVMVMYLGRVVEHGPAAAVFAQPRHPYTQALLSATPTVDASLRRERILLKGELPSPMAPPSGCTFHTRCPWVEAGCRSSEPALEPLGAQRVACFVAPRRSTAA